MMGNHCLLRCQVLQRFCLSIKVELQKILNMDILLDPEYFILGGVPKEVISKDQRYIFCVLLIVNRNVVKKKKQN